MAESIHASCFAYHGAGCLLVGPTGSGKSHLLTQAIMLGAELVADDQVILTAADGSLLASSPRELAGVLELHGLGIIRHPAVTDIPVRLAIKLGQAGERLPEPAYLAFKGIDIPVLKLDASCPGTAAKLLLYLRAMQEQRILPQDWHPARG